MGFRFVYVDAEHGYGFELNYIGLACSTHRRKGMNAHKAAKPYHDLNVSGMTRPALSLYPTACLCRLR
jgi:hypothetical protein